MRCSFSVIIFVFSDILEILNFKSFSSSPIITFVCKVLIIEPRGVINTGESGGDLTSENDVWI